MSVFKRWNGSSWETIGPQISSTRFDDTNHMVAPEYSSTSTYNVGEYVVQSDKLYKCISAIESAEEWTAAHWTQVSMSGEVSDLNSALSPLNNSVIITKDVAGYTYIDYTFEVGKRYYFRNMYSGAVMANTTATKSSSAVTIESITGGATNEAILSFQPTQAASILRVYFTSANGKAEIGEWGTTKNTVDIINESYSQIANYRKISVENSTNSIYYPVVIGKTYRFTLISGNGVQLYTRNTPAGSNIETIISSLTAGESVEFTPNANADYIRILTNGLQLNTLTISELGTLLEAESTNRKKPYQSGQIHFTVPVNQKRLYFTQGNENITQDNETDIVNVNCVLMLPQTYTPIGDKTNLLMIVHGSGGGVTETTWFRDDATVLAFFQRFLDAGFAIFDCNGYKNGSEGQESWGVDTASIAYHKAYEYVVKNYNVTDEMCIYGFSMGGLNALNYCNMFPGGIKALGLGSPVVSLYNTIWVDTSVQAKGDVSRAYGFAVSGTYEADTVGNCDAYTRIKTIDDVDYYLQRLPTVKIWHGDSDTAVYYQYSQRLYNAIKNSGGFAYYRIVTGKGHEICYGGNANVTNEIIMYFKRFVLTER